MSLLCTWNGFSNRSFLTRLVCWIDHPAFDSFIDLYRFFSSIIIYLDQNFILVCCTAIFISALLCSVHMDAVHISSVHFLCCPQAVLFYVLGSSGLQYGCEAVPSVTEQWRATGRPFVSQSTCAVSALGPPVLLLWGLGEGVGVLPVQCKGWMGGNLILWQISSSQEPKLSHLCPRALWLLFLAPARLPSSPSPKPHLPCLWALPATRLTRGGWIGFGREKAFWVGVSRIHL